MAQNTFKDRLNAVDKHLTTLYYTYAQFYTSSESHFFYRGLLKSNWKEANAALHKLFDAETGELIEDEAQFARAAAIIDALERISLSESERITQQVAKDPVKYSLPISQSLTAADHEFMNSALKRIAAGASISDGVTECYWETGTEGVYWAVEEPDKEGYDGLHRINEGDHLTIYGDDGIPLFMGIIVFDRESGWSPYHPDKPFGMGQQAAGGFWVHWIQKGYSAGEWGSLFTHVPPFRAVLKKPPKHQS